MSDVHNADGLYLQRHSFHGDMPVTTRMTIIHIDLAIILAFYHLRVVHRSGYLIDGDCDSNESRE